MCDYATSQSEKSEIDCMVAILDMERVACLFVHRGRKISNVFILALDSSDQYSVVQ